MADGKVLTTDLYEAQLKQEIADITKLLNDQATSFALLKKQASSLKSSVGSLNVTNKNHQEQLEKVSNEANKLSKEQKEQQRAAEALNKQRQRGLAQLAKLEAKERELQDAATMQVKSLEDLMKQTNALNKIRNKLDKTTESGKQRFDELTQKIKENNEALKLSDKEVGRNQRNVGNYADALEGLGGGFGAAINGAKGLGKQFLKLLANPIVALIGAIVLGLTSLFKAFKRTEEGGNMFADTMAKIGGAVSAVVGRLGKLAKGIVDVVKGDKQLKDLKGTFKGLRQEIQESANAAVELNKLERAVIKLRNETKVTSSEIAKVSELQAAIADDATLSFQKRMEADEMARKASERRASVNVELMRTELELINRRVEQNERVNKFDQELLNQRADMQSQLIQSELEYSMVVFENAKRRREINQDNFEQQLDFLIDTADNQKTVNERIIQDSQEALNIRKRILDETREVVNESFRQQIDLFNEQFQIQIDINKLLTLNNKESFEYARSLGLSEIATNRLLEVIRERRLATQDLIEAERLLRDIESQEIQETIDLELQKINTVVESEIAANEKILQSKQNRFNKEKEFIEKTRELTRNSLSTLATEFSNALTEINNLQQQSAQIRLDAAEDNLSSLQEQLNAEIEAQKNGKANSVNIYRERIQEEKAIRDRALKDLEKAQKREAQIQLLSQAQSITTAVAKTIEQFTAGFPIVGTVLGLAAAASLIAAFAGYKAQIKSQSRGFAEGTEYLTRDGEPQGRDTIPIMADEGERIISSKVNKEIPRSVKNKDIPELVRRGLSSEIYLGGMQGNAKDLEKIQSNKDIVDELKGVKSINKDLYKFFTQQQKDIIPLPNGHVLKREGNSIWTEYSDIKSAFM